MNHDKMFLTNIVIEKDGESGARLMVEVMVGISGSGSLQLSRVGGQEPG